MHSVTFLKPGVTNTELSRADLDQVNELLAIIAAHKEIGVTGVSVMFSFFKCRIQPIQQRHTLGFEYIGAEDPSRMCAEELTNDAALIRVRRVLLDVDAVPYVPQLFSAQNTPKPVSIRTPHSSGSGECRTWMQFPTSRSCFLHKILQNR
jgi:hypothetical protein